MSEKPAIEEVIIFILVVVLGAFVIMAVLESFGIRTNFFANMSVLTAIVTGILTVLGIRTGF